MSRKIVFSGRVKVLRDGAVSRELKRGEWDSHAYRRWIRNVERPEALILIDRLRALPY